MDPEKRISRSIGAMNKSLNMDLKDIIKEHTLPFLPAKSLLRFRAVCWDWNRRISSPFFAHNQSHFFRTLSGFLCQPREGLPSFISLDPNSYGIPEASLEFLQVPVDIKASSNGLLCCQARTDERSYYICNPVNKQWKVLPKPTCDHGPNPALVLIFDQPLQNFAVDYKLVCAFPSSDFDDGHEFEIYSSETGMWKLSGEICFGNRKLDPDSGVHVKGIVYWMSNNYIVAYDLTKDRSRLIDSFGLENGCLGVMHGELCYANMNKLTVWVKKMSNFYSNTMEMGSGNRTWSKKHRFTFENASEKETDIKTWALLFVGDGLVVAQVGEDKIAACDVKTSEITVLSKTLGDGKLRSYDTVRMPAYSDQTLKLNVGLNCMSSASVELTEAETEYAVNVVKHIFDGHIVFQYNCTNTIPEQLLKVTVIVDASEAENFSEVASKPLISLPGQLVWGRLSLNDAEARIAGAGVVRIQIH